MKEYTLCAFVLTFVSFVVNSIAPQTHVTMQISISGGSGFIGNELMKRFASKGWNFTIIDRKAFSLPDDEFCSKMIEGNDTVINLAGATINKRWTTSYKEEIYNSRILTTRKISQAIIKAKNKPKLLISNSGIGIYDANGSHTEGSQDLAVDLMGNLCKDWEKEAFSAKDHTRVVIFRTGIVLGNTGGALKTMYPIFNLGLGGMIGSGRQGFSWIHIEDLIKAYGFAIEHLNMEGIFNAVAPNPVTNQYFTRTFGKVLRRPAIMKVPVFALKMVFGKGADTLASGQNVVPGKLVKNGFEFKFPTIEYALMDLYKKL
jgi:uncharacterized protein